MTLEHTGLPLSRTGRGSPGARRVRFHLIELQCISHPAVPAGSDSSAFPEGLPWSSQRAYPFSPRRSPSYGPGGGTSACPGDRGPAGPGASADATRLHSWCAFRLAERGPARSARANPGRTRGAFAARALGSGRPLGLCSHPAAARAANQVGRKAGDQRCPRG